MKSSMPLRFRVFLTTAISSFIPLILAVTILHFIFIDEFEEQIASQALDIAKLAAEKVMVVKAYSSSDPSKELQPIATAIQKNTNAVFVVFLSMEGIRYSHPNKTLIGGKFTGDDEGRVLKGEFYTSKAVGVSGPSIRAFAPIFDADNKQVGAVSVGFWQPNITMTLSRIYQTFYFVVPLSFFMIMAFSVALSKNIKNLIFGMEPIEIATLLKERDSLIHSVKEGIIAIDDKCNITVINQTAQNLFPSDTEFIGRNILELIPDSKLPNVMKSQEAEEDQQTLINGNLVVTNRIPLIISGRVVGAIATFRPLTEMNKIAEELTGVKKIVNALRAKTHEFLNKLHVVSGLIQLEAYDEAQKYISNLTHKEQSLIGFLSNNIHSSAIAGLLMGKASEAAEKNLQLIIDTNSNLFGLPNYFDEQAMVIVLGNLVENAFDAVSQKESDRKVEVLLQQDTRSIRLTVKDYGLGIEQKVIDKIYTAGFTTKPEGQGYGLANVKNRVDVAKGKIEVETSTSGTTFRVTIPCQFS